MEIINGTGTEQTDQLLEELRRLQKEQIGAPAAEWTEEKRARLLELRAQLVPSGELTAEHRAALARQGTVGLRRAWGEAPQPELTPTERNLIVEANRLSAPKRR